MLNGLKQFIIDLFANPDGSGSTKRTAGWIMLIIGCFLGCYFAFSSDSETVHLIVFGTFITGGLAAFGISSKDTMEYFKNVKKH